MKRFLCAFLAVSATVLAQLPNGEVAGAIGIAIGINPNAPAGIDTMTFSNAGEADPLSLGLPAMCGSGANSDVFFGFTASNNAQYTFSTSTPVGFTAGTHLDTILQVLNDTATTSLGCDDDSGLTPTFSSQLTVSLTAGQNVIVRIASWSGTADGSFYLSVSEFIPPPPPANDVCAGADVITEGVLFNGSTLSSTAGGLLPAGCTSFTATTLDVWHSYTPTTSGTVRLTRAGTGATRTAVYTGACGAETIVFSSCNANLTNVFDVVAGTPYLIRVGIASAIGSAYTLFLEAPVTPTVSSDTCAGAAALSVGINAGTTVGATVSNPSPVCASFTNTNPDVWFTFTSPVACAASVTRSADGEGATRLAVYTTPDCVAFSAVGTTACGTGVMTWVALAGTTYYVRAGVFSAATAGPFLLTVTCVPFEPNDSCAGAIPVFNGPNGPFNNTGTVLANDVGFSTPAGCNAGSLGGHDLFYTYVPACDGTLTVSTCGGNNVNEPGVLFDSQVTVYDTWTCGVGGTPIACNDDAGTPLCGLQGWEAQVSLTVTAGTQYLIRVAGFGSAVGSFNLTLTLSTAQIAVIGTGCGTPAATLAGSGPPVMGSTGTISVTAQPNANGVLLFSNPNIAMAYTPFGACTIYVQNPGMGVLLPIFTDALGNWSLTATFPIDPSLDCVGWDFQGLVIGAAGIEFTNALRLILGT